MKICIAASEGGHMTEALYLRSAYADHDVFLITGANPRMSGFPYPIYMVPKFARNPLKLFEVIWKVFRAFRRERPSLVLSTGSEIALPVFLMARLFGAKTVFIETITRVENPSLTARLVYPFVDRFYVQNPETLKAFGPRAEYHGGIV
jgi:UDP-N-acetylglucosamine:LPS N-acetylglucosamine transferase